MKKKLLFIATICIASTFVACTPSSKGSIDIGIAIPETHVERWIRDADELKAGVESFGYTAAVGYADTDQSKQNKQIEDFITKKAKLIIVGQVNEGVREAVEKAHEAGVIVLCYDRLILNSDKYDYYVSFDNFKIGQMQGNSIAEGLNLSAATTTKNITLFVGAATDNNAHLIFNGAMSILKPYIQTKTLNIIGPSALSSKDKNFTRLSIENWQPNIAKSRMENLLNGDAGNVTLDAVLAPNDTIARALIEALSADSKYSTTETLPLVTGQDGELASIKMIKEGKQFMTIFKDTRIVTKCASIVADSLLKGEEPNIENVRKDTETYNTGLKTVTSYLAAPVVVTQDNYKEVLIDSGFYSESSLEE